MYLNRCAMIKQRKLFKITWKSSRKPAWQNAIKWKVFQCMHINKNIKMCFFCISILFQANRISIYVHFHCKIAGCLFRVCVIILLQCTLILVKFRRASLTPLSVARHLHVELNSIASYLSIKRAITSLKRLPCIQQLILHQNSLYILWRLCDLAVASSQNMLHSHVSV